MSAQMTKSASYVKVALEDSVQKLLEYRLKDEHMGVVEIGSLVEVPVGRAARQGFIVEFLKSPTFSPLKEVMTPAANNLVVPPDLMELSRWVSEYHT